MRAFRPLPIGLGIAAAIIALDQATKWAIVEVVMQPPRVIHVAPFFNIVMGWNRGVSFGMFNSPDSSAWILSLIALVIVGVLMVWLVRSGRPLVAAAIGLIIGGALGNVIDRIRFGAVADFLDFYVGGYHWPAFNVADSAITIGAVILVADSLFHRGEKN